MLWLTLFSQSMSQISVKSKQILLPGVNTILCKQAIQNNRMLHSLETKLLNQAGVTDSVSS